MIRGMQDVTLLFGTIARPMCVQRMIRSVRNYYPDIIVRVADQNGPTPEMERFYADYDVKTTYLPFDSGVSLCRAELTKLSDTEFILFGDDDFIFTPSTNVAAARNVLSSLPDVGVLGGSMIDIKTIERRGRLRKRRRYEKLMYIDEQSRGLLTIPIDFIKPKFANVNQEPVYFCDIVINWALCRRSVFDDERCLWDAQFKSAGEHENFFLQLKKFSEYRVAYYPALQCDHLHEETDPSYEELRSRQEGWQLFAKKWELDWHMDVGQGLRSFQDYGRLTPYTATPAGCAQQVPSSTTDFLRVWDHGEAAASVSFKGQLADARQRAKIENEWAERIRARAEQLRTANSQARGQIEQMRKRIQDIEANTSRRIEALKESRDHYQAQSEEAKERIQLLERRLADWGSNVT